MIKVDFQSYQGLVLHSVRVSLLCMQLQGRCMVSGLATQCKPNLNSLEGCEDTLFMTAERKRPER